MWIWTLVATIVSEIPHNNTIKTLSSICEDSENFTSSARCRMQMFGTDTRLSQNPFILWIMESVPWITRMTDILRHLVSVPRRAAGCVVYFLTWHAECISLRYKNLITCKLSNRRTASSVIIDDTNAYSCKGSQSGHDARRLSTTSQQQVYCCARKKIMFSSVYIQQ